MSQAIDSAQVTETTSASSDGLRWHPHDVSLQYQVGELTLATLRYPGIRSEPSVFRHQAFSGVEPPLADLNSHGSTAAYIRSCPLIDRLPKLSFVSGHLRFVPDHYRRFGVRIDGTFDGYMSKFSKKSRGTLLRKVRKADSSNCTQSTFETFCDPSDFDRFFEIATGISERSFQHRLLGQGLPTDDDFQDQVKRIADRQQIRGFVLNVDDAPAAYNLCPINDDGVMLYDHTGYDPAFHDRSPGTVLQYKIIESLFQSQGVRIYDLCTGEGRHKELFANDHVDCANVYFFPITIRNVGSVGLKLILDQTMLTTKNIMDRFGIKGWLKKEIRRRW